MVAARAGSLPRRAAAARDLARSRVTAAIARGTQSSSNAVTTSVVTEYTVRGGRRPAHQNRSGIRAQVTGSASTCHTGRTTRFWCSSAHSKCEPWMFPVRARFRA
ncbi:hypothetical protein GCM10009751_19210 [Myceligenerans crystallogenes]|uniref:Uncharacterized protein n=1 Tax=Myceligenerans crystallogenes TaxID=316335 RepID=A0ABN2NDN2_9MICO